MQTNITEHCFCYKYNSYKLIQFTIMLRIEIKEGENIERALKRYKRKHRNVKVMQNLRDKQYFRKPSVVNRRQIQKASYIQGLRDAENI